MIFSLDLSQCQFDSDFMHFKHFLSTRNRNRLERFRDLNDARRSFFGELLACTLAWINHPTETLARLDHNAYGKPIFKFSNTALSISHSGNWVIAASVVNSQVIGVDVESIVEFDWREIAKRFHGKDIEYLEAADTLTSLRRFYRLWTCREAWVKTGCGSLFESFQRCFSNPTWTSLHWISHYLDSSSVLSICTTLTDVEENLSLMNVNVKLYPQQNISLYDEYAPHTKIVIISRDFNNLLDKFRLKIISQPVHYCQNTLCFWRFSRVEFFVIDDPRSFELTRQFQSREIEIEIVASEFIKS